jgi:hypothetical protein
MGTINDADPVTGQWTDNAGQTRDRNGRVLANADGSKPSGNNKFGGLFEGAKEWFNNKNAPQIGANPYQSQWGDLIGQLRQQSSGTGPSLAGGAYNQAHSQAMNDYATMSHGGSAGAARQAQRNMGTANAGLAQGYSNARLQEQLAARQQLQGALAGAGNAWFQPQQANLQATMGTQSNGQQLMNMLSQMMAGFGSLTGGGGGGK